MIIHKEVRVEFLVYVMRAPQSFESPPKSDDPIAFKLG
jgi:hypothetical protein